MEKLSGTFWLSLAGILAGVLGIIISAINKSKCSNIDCCCGLIRCVREVDLEVQLEEHKLDMGVPDTPK